MTQREKTIASGVGILLGAVALYFVVLEPYLDRLSAADATIARQQSALQDANKVLESRLRATKRWRDVSTNQILTDGSSAESQLLNRVRDCAGRAGLSLKSIKNEKGEKLKGFEHVVVRREAEGSMRQIARFLYELQNTDIPVRVIDLTINALKDGQDNLGLSITLSTIYQPPAAAKVASAAAATGVYQ